MVQDPILDRSSNKVFPLSKSAKTLNTFTEQHGLSEPWRRKCPTTKLFSFFSHVHRTYSHIDFFLLDNRLFSNVNSCGYHSIVISDHAPTSLDLNFHVQIKPFRQCRFNSALLAEDSYRQFLRSQITLFFELNDLPKTKRGTLWEASKAYIRGQLISFVSNMKKIETSHMVELMQQIKDVDNKYAANPDPNLYKERLKLQTDFDLASTNKAKLQILKSRQRFFESGDNAGKLLAHQIRAEASSRLISAISSNQGETYTDPVKINETLAKFYTDLYTSDHHHHYA